MQPTTKAATSTSEPYLDSTSWHRAPTDGAVPLLDQAITFDPFVPGCSLLHPGEMLRVPVSRHAVLTGKGSYCGQQNLVV